MTALTTRSVTSQYAAPWGVRSYEIGRAHV